MAFGTAFLAATAAAVVDALRDGAVDVVTGERPLVTSSDEERLHPCGSPLFFRRDDARAVHRLRVDDTTDWPRFRAEHAGIVAGANLVEVSIQGETERPVTLMRVEFVVRRMRRPDGEMFSVPCGDPISGRGLEVDLDRRPPRITASARDADSYIGGVDATGRAPRPIRFPWTVSLTDPLPLLIIARTRRCLCEWRARIPWRSGARSGVLRIDNRGRGYRVIGGAGVRDYVSTEAGWSRLR